MPVPTVLPTQAHRAGAPILTTLSFRRLGVVDRPTNPQT